MSWKVSNNIIIIIIREIIGIQHPHPVSASPFSASLPGRGQRLVMQDFNLKVDLFPCKTQEGELKNTSFDCRIIRAKG